MSAEQSIREELAEVGRILEYEKLIDAFGHVSYRLDDGALLVTPHMPPGKARPEDFLRTDAQGNVLSGAGRPPGEMAIHTAVYRNRPDVRCAAHFHPPRCVLLSVLGQEIIPLTNMSALFHEGTPIYDHPELILNDRQGDALLQALGRCKAVLLRGHGVVVVAETPAQLAVRAVALERSAEFQYAAMLAGAPKRYSAEDLARTAADEPKHVQRCMRYYRAVLGGGGQ
ncbi:MAG: class II aldolase/adducin family protein [Candidatus Tectomicrobia bacterium]|nr:class II aldolase/adducin family protein [Candidatus Tectomicrobia bacterium]